MEPHLKNASRNVYRICCDSPLDLVLTCLARHDMFVCFVLNSAFSFSQATFAEEVSFMLAVFPIRTLFGVALADIRYVATIKDRSTSFD